MDTFTFEITERIGVLSKNKNGWTREINRVSFNGGETKFDIREWSPDHKKMSKGMTFTEGEASSIAALIANWFIKNGMIESETKPKEREPDSKKYTPKPKKQEATVINFPFGRTK